MSGKKTKAHAGSVRVSQETWMRCLEPFVEWRKHWGGFLAIGLTSILPAG